MTKNLKIYTTTIIILSIQLLGCSALYAPTYQYRATLEYDASNHSITYDGYLGQYELARTINRIEKAKSDGQSVERLLIRSSGGQIDASIRFAYYLNDNDISVEVLDYCLSSCAMYLAPAAKKTIVPAGSALGFHGTVCTFLLYDIPALLPRAHELQLLEETFYEHLNIDSMYARFSPYGFVEYQSPFFWSFNQRQLELFGITNILIEEELTEDMVIDGATIRPLNIPNDDFEDRISKPTQCNDYTEWSEG